MKTVLAPVVVKERALGLTKAKRQANDDEPSLSDRFIFARQRRSAELQRSQHEREALQRKLFPTDLISGPTLPPPTDRTVFPVFAAKLTFQ